MLKIEDKKAKGTGKTCHKYCHNSQMARAVLGLPVLVSRLNVVAVRVPQVMEVILELLRIVLGKEGMGPILCGPYSE
jgi:hypothetical protein